MSRWQYLLRYAEVMIAVEINYSPMRLRLEPASSWRDWNWRRAQRKL